MWQDYDIKSAWALREAMDEERLWYAKAVYWSLRSSGWLGVLCGLSAPHSPAAVLAPGGGLCLVLACLVCWFGPEGL